MTKLKPIGDHLFIKRVNQATSVGGIDISEKAQVKSYVGEVVAVADEKCVEVGDIVHLPHTGIENRLVNGEELAITKCSLLFAKKVSGAWVPINKNVLVRKCEEDHIRDESGAIALYMTQNFIEWTNWVETISVASDCRHMGPEYVGMFCVAPENDPRLNRILDSKDYCLGEELIKFLTDGD